jgi:hypothetical protein
MTDEYGISKESKLRKEADELRAVAGTAKNEITRKTLLRLAEEYDRLAAHPVTNYPKKIPDVVRVKFKLM